MPNIFSQDCSILSSFFFDRKREKERERERESFFPKTIGSYFKSCFKNDF